ncbi:GFA family protein [Seohaeicola saemankumensis]|uniref:GFA family protein n=1 Tax=Seohaeicola saemankumensis TaxID=481181 RepID=A0ABW3TA74_9RHOB
MPEPAPIFHAQCYCGAVKLEAEGEPLLQGYCHCSSCRQRSAAPMIGYTIWLETAVTFREGKDLINRFPKLDKPEASKWMSCKVCGCAIGAHLTERGAIDIFVGAFRDFPFQPNTHINYGEAIIRMNDGLPKYRDMPGRSGGSDELMQE